MAEELLNNSERLPSADIFSLGLTIYEMCCFAFEEDMPVHHVSNHNYHHHDPANNYHHHENHYQHYHQHHGDRHQHPLCDDHDPQLALMCFTIHRGLPSEGPSWHILRENRAPSIPDYRSKALNDVVVAMMQANYNDRPAASELLMIHEIAEANAESYIDDSLMNAPRPIDNHQQLGFGRSISYNPEPLQIEVTVTTTGTTSIDYAALGDRAFTPHFNVGPDERSMTPLFPSK